MAANFFDTGSGASGNINPGDLQTIINARDATLAAETGAQTAQGLAQTAQAAAASSAAGVQVVANAATVSAADAAASATAASTSAAAAAQSVTDAAAQAANVAQSVTDAQAASDAAGTEATLAQQWASADQGVQVAPGLESAKSYSEKALSAVSAAIAMPKRTLADADFVSGKYTLVETDLVSYIVCTNTTAPGEIVLPPGLFTGPGPTGTQGTAALHVVRRGSQNVTFGVPSTATVVAPNRLIDQLFTFSTTTPVTSYSPASPHQIVVPAGNARKLTLVWFSLHNLNAQNTVSLTATNVTNLTKRVAEATVATGYYAGTSATGIMAAVWTADLADSATATTVDITPTTTSPWCYALWGLATGNTAGTSGYTATSSLAATSPTAAQALTPAEAQDMLVFGMAFQGADANPLTISGGGTPTTAVLGQTGPTRTTKDLTVVFGYEVRPDTTAETYTATSAKTAETCRAGLILQPNTVGGGATSVITGGGTPTLSTLGAHATVWIDSDGITYDVEL